MRVTTLTEVSGLQWEREVIELREGGDPDAPTRRLPGRMKPGQVTLTRGLTADLTFEQWMRDPVPGVSPGGRCHSRCSTARGRRWRATTSSTPGPRSSRSAA